MLLSKIFINNEINSVEWLLDNYANDPTLPSPSFLLIHLLTYASKIKRLGDWSSHDAAVNWIIFMLILNKTDPSELHFSNGSAFITVWLTHQQYAVTKDSISNGSSYYRYSKHFYKAISDQLTGRSKEKQLETSLKTLIETSHNERVILTQLLEQCTSKIKKLENKMAHITANSSQTPVSAMEQLVNGWNKKEEPEQLALIKHKRSSTL